QGQVAFAAAQGLGGQVHADQCGGACGVEGDRRAFEAEGVGEAAGRDTARVGDRDLADQVLGYLVHAVGVVAAHDPHENAGTAAPQGGRVDPGRFECVPGDLQQDPLLGVHDQCFAGRDAEEVG